MLLRELKHIPAQLDLKSLAHYYHLQICQLLLQQVSTLDFINIQKDGK